MTIYCLDSTAIIDFLKGNIDVKKVFDKLDSSSFFVSEISIFEVASGILMYGSKKEFDLFLEFINNLHIISSSTGFALDAARFAGKLKKKGITMESMDLLIVGMMTSHGLNKIITRNEKHFNKFSGINVISY